MVPEARDVVDIAQVSKSQLVLDVGSGFGGITAEALERGTEVVSLDFPMKYLAYVARLKRTSPVIADVTFIPFKDSAFDRVMSKPIWYSVPGHDGRTRFVLETNRVLKNGGLVILSAVWNRLCYYT